MSKTSKNPTLENKALKDRDIYQNSKLLVELRRKPKKKKLFRLETMNILPFHMVQ